MHVIGYCKDLIYLTWKVGRCRESPFVTQVRCEYLHIQGSIYNMGVLEAAYI